jgi:hypothetical protein
MAATLIQPVLFSTRFGIPSATLGKAGLIDPILNSDTKLFIDPLLIAKSVNPLVRSKGLKLLEKRFRDVLDLLDSSQAPGDVAWKAAYKQLDLDERAETGLGFGGASTHGSSRPSKLRNSILGTAQQIIRLGEKNPNIIPLMGLFEEGVGADTISDMTTNVLLPLLCEITENFCKLNGVPTKPFGSKYGNRELPENPLSTVNPPLPVILVPRDILRDLPLAADWSDVSRVAMEVQGIRDSVNAMFGDWSKASVKERKKAIRNAALSSLKNLRQLLTVVAEASESYDEKADLDGHYTFRRILSEDRDRYKGLIKAPKAKSQDTLRATVEAVLREFKDLVEDNNLWELLWHGTEPRHERASQLLFFAVSNVLCAVNDVDISPETNSGGGPVDFKFSTGYQGRVLVEIKLSKGQVVHGYSKQLERYKLAAKTEAGIFVVIDVGGMGAKLRVIQRLQKAAEKRGETVSQIIYVDARRKKSASKI